MDLSQLSNEQLIGMLGQSAAPQAVAAPTLSDIPTEQLIQMAGITQPSAQPQNMTPGKALTGGIMDLGNKLSLGAMDEIVAGGNTMIDDVKAGVLNMFGYNEKPGNYDAELAKNRQLIKEYQDYAPVSSALNNAAGVLLPVPSIFGKAGQAAPSIFNVAGKSAAVGAGYGAAGGFLSGEGSAENRIQNAETGALIGGALGGAVPVIAKGVSGAAKYIGGKLSDAADAVQETGLGIMYGDKARGLKSLPKYLNEAGEVVDIPSATTVEAPIEQSMALLRKRGLLDNAPNDPRALKTFLKQNEQKVGTQLQDLIADGNALLGKQKLPVKYNNTAVFFDDIGSQNPEKAAELIKDFEKVVNNYENAGTYFNPASGKDVSKAMGAVSRINNVKTGVNSMIKQLWETDRNDPKVNLFRAIYKDLQAAEEDAIQSVLPERFGEFKDLKDAYGALVGLGQTVNKAGARKALTLSNALEGGSKPIGIVAGVTAPVLGTGSLTAAALTAGGKALLNTAERRYPMSMANAYQSAAKGLNKSSGMIQSLTDAVNPLGLATAGITSFGVPDQQDSQQIGGLNSSSPAYPQAAQILSETNSDPLTFENQQGRQPALPDDLFASALNEQSTKPRLGQKESEQGTIKKISSPNTPKPSILDQAFNEMGDSMKLQKIGLDTNQPRFELPEALIKSVITQESSGNKKAVSKAGAQGLMQLMPATGREWHKKLGIEEPYDPFNPEQNRKIGTAYLEYLVDMYDGDLELALTAYNQGFGRVNKLLARNKADSLDGIIDDLGPDGKKYAKMILNRMKKYEQVTA